MRVKVGNMCVCGIYNVAKLKCVKLNFDPVESKKSARSYTFD